MTFPEHPSCPFPKMWPSELVRDDAYYMKMAFNQAVNAWNQNEVPIGCVIEWEGQIIGSAFNQVEAQKDPTAHAEILAITQAAQHIGDWRLNDCTLYVTKEPCPMCAGATIMSRLKRVVYAFRDPKMGCLGGATAIQNITSLNHHPLITHGVLEAECKSLLQAYFKLKREI